MQCRRFSPRSTSLAVENKMSPDLSNIPGEGGAAGGNNHIQVKTIGLGKLERDKRYGEVL